MSFSVEELYRCCYIERVRTFRGVTRVRQMAINNTAILNHLQASKLLVVQEWATVLWVKAVVAGRVVCRFVSKKIGAKKMQFAVLNNIGKVIFSGSREAAISFAEEFVSANPYSLIEVVESNQVVGKMVYNSQKKGKEVLQFGESCF